VFDDNVTDDIGPDMEMIKMIANNPDITINDTVITDPTDTDAKVTVIMAPVVSDPADANAGKGVAANPEYQRSTDV
jgi:hypothetical protein